MIGDFLSAKNLAPALSVLLLLKSFSAIVKLKRDKSTQIEYIIVSCFITILGQERENSEARGPRKESAIFTKTGEVETSREEVDFHF